jgi:hypothetical protein
MAAEILKMINASRISVHMSIKETDESLSTIYIKSNNLFKLSLLLSKNVYYATSRKVAGAKLDEVNECFSIYLILTVALAPGVYSAAKEISTRRGITLFVGCRARLARTADKFSAISQQIV